MYYNLFSLFFGLCAWIIPVIFFRRQYRQYQASGIFASLVCALICLVFQVFGIRHEVLTGDFSAIEDTIDALCMICGAHGTITLLLNGVLLGKK
ncbi:MAG: hypothetical protein IJX37_01935 [Oscillospiraceae bacterium]|nr:hypothetical protein [Oscillospiraceae bacterium]